jgi:hypothetical protein
VLAVVAAEQEHEVGEVGPEGFDVVGRAADKALQGGAELGVIGREPVTQQIEELGEFHRIGGVEADVHRRCPPARRMAVVTRCRLRWSRQGITSRRLTGCPAARLAAMSRMCRSLMAISVVAGAGKGPESARTVR